MTERAAPYPADTRAKGWRFEIDYEKVEQSDTWDLAAEIPMAQHSLLMMWLISWRQEPCGSFPADEAVIRSKCKIPPKVWAAVRDVLMRGWWQADDGRMYHATITARVLEMLEYRRKNAERVAAFKAARREQQAGNALPPEQQQGKNDTGTGTTEAKASEKRGSRLPAGWVLPDAWQQWAEQERPELDVSIVACKFADHWHSKPGAAGRKLDWLATWRNWVREERAPAGRAAAVVSFRQSDLDAKAQTVHRMTGGLLGRAPSDNDFIDMEDNDAPAIANG